MGVPGQRGGALNVLEIDGVSVVIEDRVIVDRVSFTVEKGHGCALLGPSGSGKTTLFRVIAGLTKATTGVTRYYEREISGPQRGIWMAFQDYDAFPWLTVRKNMLLVDGSACGAELSADNVGKVLSAVGLTAEADKYPGQLSGGMRKRLALGRCLLGGSDLVLLDEAFTSLDVAGRNKLYRLVHKLLVAREVTTVSITHDIEEAVMLATKIIVSRSTPFSVDAVVEIGGAWPRPEDFHQTSDFESACSEIRGAAIGS